MPFSHRDRRVHRLVRRSLGVAAAGSVLLGGLAFCGPTAALEVGGLVGLAALGEGLLWTGERATTEYARDLRASRGGGKGHGFLRAEVGSDVGLERPVGLRSRPSPHVRVSVRSTTARGRARPE